MNTTLQVFAQDYRDAVEDGNAPDYGEMIAIRAIAGDYGTAIVAEFHNERYLSPYFSQHDSEGDCRGDGGGECEAPDDCEYGWCGSDRFEVQQDAEEWLSVMSGATDWSEWDWAESARLNPNRRDGDEPQHTYYPKWDWVESTPNG